MKHETYVVYMYTIKVGDFRLCARFVSGVILLNFFFLHLPSHSYCVFLVGYFGEGIPSGVSHLKPWKRLRIISCGLQLPHIVLFLLRKVF